MTVTCPRCGNDAEYLEDEAFSLLRCEFCGDDIDAVDLLLLEVDRDVQAPPALAGAAPPA